MLTNTVHPCYTLTAHSLYKVRNGPLPETHFSFQNLQLYCCNTDNVSFLPSDNLHLTRIAHVEENKEKNKGKRYFVELDITDKESKTKYRIGNYVYKPSKDDALCFPKGYVWQTNIKVYLLTPLRNQFKWLQYHVENLQYIIKTVQDNNLHLIVVDFNSTDGNITKLLESSYLNYTLINMGEPFNKVIGLNKGASGVNNDSIVFVLDLHLEMPLHLFDQVRKVS